MNPYIKIIRPGNVLMALITIVLVALIDLDFSLPVILAIIVVFFAISAGNVINDYYDYNIDLINRPDRVLPSGQISLKAGRNYAYLLFAGAIITEIISYILTRNLIPLIIVIFAIIVLYLYAWKFKTTPLLGNFVVGFITGLSFVFGGYTINNPHIIMISYYLGFFACAMTLAREITKDIEDMEGDKKEGAKTFPILFCEKPSAILTAILIIITCALCPILYINHIFNALYLVIITIAVIIFLYSAVLILKSQTPENCHKVSKYLKIGMLIAFVSFVFGSYL
ncbi:MAG: UbiA family prenyltransferase [Methanobrevibacter sp.]|uniref:UbiA family prenyltransferase n=1 Tax=Methanobrevibacter sp. TaxID=66852 RepID=UPI0026DF0ADD|nr:UbiA family prenyltransferase [Methanobrevibacter sp.]MDO5848216.1 UbiA family prenyltransferase [Methanobrevibacter sp.]